MNYIDFFDFCAILCVGIFKCRGGKRMALKLLKAVIKNLEFFEDKQLEIDLIATKQVNEYEVEDYIVTPLIGRNYALNTIALIGRNATGKTITANILSDVLSIFVGNQSLSYQKRLVEYFEETCILENYFFYKDKVFKLESTIRKNREEQTVYFEDEKLYEKKVSVSTPKKNFLVFDDTSKLVFERKVLEEANPFLKKEDSILSGIISQLKIDTTHVVIDMLEQTNFNILSSYIKEFSQEFIAFLDPSIESFDLSSRVIENDEENVYFTIKYKGSNRAISAKIIELGNYLSSGTIKGLSILNNILVILESGGYLVVDEIENHFNKAIVIKIIQIFLSDLNKNGATLIFTTHYSEIIDSIDRTDSIYINAKEEKISLKKFSEAAKHFDRVDKKKSNVILSGALNTAPNYKDYVRLHEVLNDTVKAYE